RRARLGAQPGQRRAAAAAAGLLVGRFLCLHAEPDPQPAPGRHRARQAGALCQLRHPAGRDAARLAGGLQAGVGAQEADARLLKERLSIMPNFDAIAAPTVRKADHLEPAFVHPADVEAAARKLAARKKKPNILIYLMDDVGWGDFGCY